MEKEINNFNESKTNNNNQNKNQIEYIIEQDSNEESLDKDSAMSQIKKSFNLNQGVDQEKINTFHNSLKVFKRKNLSTNPESSHIRTKSIENRMIEDKYKNTKNFLLKGKICKGQINNNPNNFIPPKSSPIVNYLFTGQDSTENSNNLVFLGSPVGSEFNFSPSQIFNKNTNSVNSGKTNIKSGKNIEPINLNSFNEGNKLDENFEYDKDECIPISINENEENNNKIESININNDENEENQKENNNYKFITTKDNNLPKIDEYSDSSLDEKFQIQNALLKLNRKKSKVSEDNKNENIKNEQNKNIKEEKEEKHISEDKKNLEDFEQKNSYNNGNERILYEEKDRINTNLEQKLIQKEIRKNFMNNNISNLNKKIKNNDNLTNKINNTINSNKSNNNLNYNNYSNLLNVGNKAIQYNRNPNSINNNYINNNLNNNYNNSFIQFNYMLGNNNTPSQLNLMMNNQPNQIINNKMHYLNNLSNKLQSFNNDNINNNYDFSQTMNQYYINTFNNNNNTNDFKKYNGLLQSPGNINIQNNYFLYNNNQENYQNNKEEKQKKKKKKKIKKLEPNAYKDKSFKYYLDNFKIIAKDQGGSRYLQNIINNYSSKEINSFFEPLFRNILNLINDPFANYLIQKLMPHFSQEQLMQILQVISPEFYEISCNGHGTRVLQQLIELIQIKELKALFYKLIKPIVCELLKDLNGTYIVQKFVNLNLKDYGIHINSIIIDNSVELCSNKHGCCVIQKYLETRDPNMIPKLIYKLLDGFSNLITDQFGNYVLKTILTINNPEYSNKIGEYISTNIIYYSKHKYSSNIVEKCFDSCTGNVLSKLISFVQEEQNFRELIIDEHGNYVVQKVISISNLKKRKEMLSIIKGLFPILKQTHFGEKIIHRISTTYQDIFNI